MIWSVWFWTSEFRTSISCAPLARRLVSRALHPSSDGCVGGEHRAVLRETPAIPRAPQCCCGTHVLLQPETSSGPGWEGEPVGGWGVRGEAGLSFPSGNRERRRRGCSPSSSMRDWGTAAAVDVLSGCRYLAKLLYGLLSRGK